MSEDGKKVRPVRNWRIGAILVSAVAITSVVIRGLFPSLIKLDAISVALIVIALLPWMRSVIKSIELPGIGKIEMREIDRIAQDARAAGMAGDTESSGAHREGGASGKTAESVHSYTRRASEQASAWQSSSDGDHWAQSGPDGMAASVPATVRDFQKFQKMHASDDPTSRASFVLKRSRVRANELGASGLSAVRIQMADMRSAIEAKLAELGYFHKIVSWSGAAQMVSELRSEGAIDRMQSNTLLSVLDVIDRVLEGEEMTIPAAMKAIDLAGDVLETLDAMIKAEVDAIEPEDPYD